MGKYALPDKRDISVVSVEIRRRKSPFDPITDDCNGKVFFCKLTALGKSARAALFSLLRSRCRPEANLSIYYTVSTELPSYAGIPEFVPP